jgi:GNAT superfamily N-acetyltransferase
VRLRPFAAKRGSEGSVHRVEALDTKHQRAGFSCGLGALDRYLQQQAHLDAASRVAATFVLVEASSARVLGYSSLSASVLQAHQLPGALAKALPRYPHLAVTLLGRLAVDSAQKRRGLGQFLLMDALWRSAGAARHIDAMAVLAEAADEPARAFYAHFGFAPLQQSPGRMFLPMKAVAGLFG